MLVLVVRWGGITFINEDYADMHFVYGVCNGSSRAAVVAYQQRYTYPQCEAAETVQRILRKNDVFPLAKAECKLQRYEEVDVLVPNTSTRRISRTTGIAQTQI
jgi:hypothetical protein